MVLIEHELRMLDFGVVVGLGCVVVVVVLGTSAEAGVHRSSTNQHPIIPDKAPAYDIRVSGLRPEVRSSPAAREPEGSVLRG